MMSADQPIVKELETLAQALADEIGKPASLRNPSRLAELWTRATELRADTEVAFDALRSELRLQERSGVKPGNRALQARKAGFRKLRFTLKYWDDVDRLVARHMNPHVSPLLAERQSDETIELLKLMSQTLHKIANPHRQSDLASKYGCLPDILIPVEQLEQMLMAAYRILGVLGKRANIRFLDVGCGGGTTLLYAGRYFARCDGLDYEADFADAAQDFIERAGLSDSRAFAADGLTFDGYDQYDVIYFYRPMHDRDLLRELELNVINTARKHTVVVAPYDEGLVSRDDFPCARIEGPIFVTGMTDGEAQQVRRDAMASEPWRIRRGFQHDANGGIWGPVFDVASFNGTL